MAATAKFVQEAGGSARLPYANTGSAIATKDVVALVTGASGILGIAIAAISATTGTGVVELNGVWTLPKKSGDVFTAFQQVYYDTTNSRLTTSSTGNTLAGRTDAAYASAATTANVYLNRR
jgi:predicted RecA/RadA family phage recombinase